MATGVSDSDYVCTMTDESLKKAKDELNEDPKNRLGAVQKFRELVLQQPHIKCPTGILSTCSALVGRYCDPSCLLVGRLVRLFVNICFGRLSRKRLEIEA